MYIKNFTYLSQDDLEIKAMELQKRLNLYQQDSSKENSLVIAAETIRKELKSCKSTLNWPPHIQNLELDQTVMPMTVSDDKEQTGSCSII